MTVLVGPPTVEKFHNSDTAWIEDASNLAQNGSKYVSPVVVMLRVLGFSNRLGVRSFVRLSVRHTRDLYQNGAS